MDGCLAARAASVPVTTGGRAPLAASSSRGEKRQELTIEENCYLSRARVLDAVRASGCFGVQSSGGKATRQNVGCGEVNSRPISALPERTGPRNTTWHSCSSCVRLCCSMTLLPLVKRDVSNTKAPWALIASVSVSSSIDFPCASVPRIRTATCIKTRWLRRRAPAFKDVFET
jgi:hypothetical protein